MNIQTPRKRIGQEGFTLVELMIVVAIIGILAVLAIFGVSKYVANAKTGEARNALGQIAKGAVGAYESERAAPALITPGTAGLSAVKQLCDKADNAVPATLDEVTNKKYQSASATAAKDWSVGTPDKGWPCLKFSLTEPQYFQYGYNATLSTSPTTGGFNAWAEGNLSGAATATHGFWLTGKMVSGQLTVAPNTAENEGVATKTVP